MRELVVHLQEPVEVNKEEAQRKEGTCGPFAGTC